MFKLKIINKPKMIKMKCNIEFPDVVLANLQDKETTPTKETQVVVADFPFDGLSKVTVNPIPDEYIIPNGELEIIQNGIYDVSSKASAKVNVPEKVLGTKTITKNGTYNATDDNLDGYSQVEVATSGVDINDYFETTYSGTSPNNWGNQNFIKKVPDIIIDDSVTSIANLFNSYKNYVIPKIICNNNVKDFTSVYGNCTNATEIDVSGLDFSNATTGNYMFYECKSLTNLDLSNFDASKIIGSAQNHTITHMFNGCTNLTNLKFMKNLGKGYVIKANGYNASTVDLSSCSKLTHESLIDVINNLYDLNLTYDVANGGTLYTQKLNIGSTNLAKLTEEEIAIATNKGWIVS